MQRSVLRTPRTLCQHSRPSNVLDGVSAALHARCLSTTENSRNVQLTLNSVAKDGQLFILVCTVTHHLFLYLMSNPSLLIFLITLIEHKLFLAFYLFVYISM